MPRGKKGTYALAENGDGGLTPVRVASDSPGIPGVSNLSSGDWRQVAAIEAANILENRDDGWYRLVPGGDGKATFHKWKFNKGRWVGHYVMYQGRPGDFCGNVLGLLAKLEKVDAGELKPAYDTFYDPR